MYLGRDTAHRGSAWRVRYQKLQFGPRCIWGETADGFKESPEFNELQFGPRCIWGETKKLDQLLAAVSASIRPQMYLGRDYAQYPLPFQYGTLQFGPRCIWGETTTYTPGGAVGAQALQFGPRCIWGETSRCVRTWFWPPASIRPQMYLGRDVPSKGRGRPHNPASIRPQMYLGRDRAACARACSTGPRFNSVPDVSGERPSPAISSLNFSSGFNSAPDVSGERQRDLLLEFVDRVAASIRPQMYLGRDRWLDLPHRMGGSQGFNSAPDVSGERRSWSGSTLVA